MRTSAPAVVSARSLGVAVAVAVVILTRPSASPQTPSLEDLLARAADHVARFTDALSNVVVEERYTQEVAGGLGPGAARGHRVWRADVLLMKVGGPLEWRPYRDVFEVDGMPVRDRDNRLAALFERPSATSFDQAARIARESARFNIGLAGRTINTPVLTLLFLQRSIQPRFRFRLGKRERDGGLTSRVLAYRETGRPTIVRGLSGDQNRDLPASGRVWLDEASGRIVRAEAQFSAIGMQATLTASYRHDAALDLDVPATLREVYRLQHSVEDVGSIAREDGAPRAVQMTEQTVVTGAATYGNFRRFAVTADVSIRPAP